MNEFKLSKLEQFSNLRILEATPFVIRLSSVNISKNKEIISEQVNENMCKAAEEITKEIQNSLTFVINDEVNFLFNAGSNFGARKFENVISHISSEFSSIFSLLSKERNTFKATLVSIPNTEIATEYFEYRCYTGIKNCLVSYLNSKDKKEINTGLGLEKLILSCIRAEISLKDIPESSLKGTSFFWEEYLKKIEPSTHQQKEDTVKRKKLTQKVFSSLEEYLNQVKVSLSL